MVTGTKKMFVGGLSASTTIDDVKAYFESYGKVAWRNVARCRFVVYCRFVVICFYFCRLFATAIISVVSHLAFSLWRRHLNCFLASCTGYHRRSNCDYVAIECLDLVWWNCIIWWYCSRRRCASWHCCCSTAPLISNGQSTGISLRSFILATHEF